MELPQQVGQLVSLMAREAAPALLPAGSKRRGHPGPTLLLGVTSHAKKQVENTVFLLL